MQTNALSPAYPITPLQDNFGRMVVPVAGLSKLEYFTLEIFKIYLDKKDYIKTIELNKDTNATSIDLGYGLVIMEYAINDAITLLNKIEEKHKNISNEKDSVLDII